MARLRTVAVVLVVALAAFYLGSLVEFQYGGYAPDWVKTVLLYRPPTRDLDLQGLEEVFQTIQQHYLNPNADGHKLTEGAASGMVGSLLGHTRFFISGDPIHHAPPGGGVAAAIIRKR